MMIAFDTTFALSSMYLWLMFGFLTSMVNCDLQRFLMQNALVRHAVALVAFFFLFTLLDADASKTGLVQVWFQTVFVYTVFVAATKSKWYFALGVLVLLLVDQSYKKHVRALEGGPTAEQQGRQARVSRALNVGVIVLAVVGAAHYAYLQRLEYGNRFSWAKFLLGSSRPCKTYAPSYRSFAQQRA